MNSSEIAVLSDEIVKKFKDVEKLLIEKCSQKDRELWKKQIKIHIKMCKRAIHNADLSIGTCRKLQTNLGHLKRFQLLLSSYNFQNVVGMGLKTKRSDRVKWEDVISIFQGRIRTGVIVNIKHIDVSQFLEDACTLFINRIKNILKKMEMIRVYTCFCGEFIRKSCDSEIFENKYFNTKSEIIHIGTNLKEWFRIFVKDSIYNSLSEFSESGSGWALQKIISLEININKFECGNGISSYIPLPSKISRKRACINVKNKDFACFAWSVVSALYPVDKHSDRTTSYPHYSSVLDVKDLKFPITISQIPKFEKNNNISINVFALELTQKSNFLVVPVYLTKQKQEKHVNLLIIQNRYFPKDNDDDEDVVEEELTYHFCYIKDLSRLISKQCNKHKTKKFICDRCLSYFQTKESFESHTINCTNEFKVKFSKDLYIKFKNFVYKEKVPFILYADFECLLEKFNDSSLCNTSRYQKHTAYSAGFYFKSYHNYANSFYISHRGLDSMTWFAATLENVAKLIASELKKVEPMNTLVSLKDASDFCHICEKKFTENDKICRDHDHISGNFRGFAHATPCNLNYKNSFVVPIVFHNLSGYDSHFIIRDLAKNNNITLLPINKEKYISFTVHDKETKIKFRFIDSFRFLGYSLDTLASLLQQENFSILVREFPNLNSDKLKLLMRKGVFFYDYLDSIEKLDETQLPSPEYFYNKLNDEEINDSQYSHAQLVWNTFNLKNLGEYSDLYMKTDILLLAAVFETFRDTSHKTYGLDPAHYYTLPSYTFDCMLKYTKCELETIQDVDLLLFIERGIRGGISQCCNRYAKANNKYLRAYNPNIPSKTLIYVDINNMYGWAMCEPLPYGGFEWVDKNIDITCIPDDSPEGYILEVDIEYPVELHDLHKDLPFFAEHRIPPGSKFPKLITSLFNKNNYVVHYRHLKQGLEHGLRITNIHKVLKFKQSRWLKTYIDFNTAMRANAKSHFEETNIKLMNNAVYGKTMENVRNHRIVKLARRWEGRYGARNLIASPNFQSRSIFSENLIAIELKKTQCEFSKPIYIGMSILDISKVCLYDFHYDFMLKNFGSENCEVQYGDTDSLIYSITNIDPYEDIIKKHIHRFDTSNYPPDNRWNIPLVNKKVPGLMKDELNGKILEYFVGLRSKQYTYKCDGEDDGNKRAKGIKRNVVRKQIHFNDYLKCLENFTADKTDCILYRTQRCIQSKLHNVYSIEQTKIALNPYDDKRYLVPKTHKTLPWGHYSIIK